MLIRSREIEKRSILKVAGYLRKSLPVLVLMLFFCGSPKAQTTHEYIFNNNLNELNGGPALTESFTCGATAGSFGTQTTGTTNGACLTSNSFCFTDGGGLRYTNNNLIKASYTINVFFRFNTLGGYARIIDFSNSATDSGMYFLNKCLNLYPNGNIGTCPYFSTNIYYFLSFVRDGATNIISAYVDGQLFGTYNDANNLYRVPTNNTPIIFFRDDEVVKCETQPGCVKYISLSNKVSTAAEIKALFDNITNVTHATAAPPPTITLSPPADITCANSSVQLNASGASSIVWNGPAATNAANPASVNKTGKYIVTATDASGCKNKDSVVVDVDTIKPVVTVVKSGDINCKNKTVSLTGTSPGNTMTWSGGALSNVSNPANAADTGVYIVKVTDGANGCINYDSVHVGIDTLKPSVSAAVPDTITCSRISVKLTGNSSGNTLVWNGNGLVNSPDPANATKAGTYTVTATSPGNGCKKDSSVVVIVAAKPTAITFTKTNSACVGSTGTVTVTSVSGGTAPYEYSKDGSSFSSTSTLSGLPAGNNKITIRDANGCLKDSVVNIGTASGPIDMYASLDPSTCGKPDGVITVDSVKGGVGPYSYAINSGSYGTDSVFSALGPGAQLVKVKDANGCVYSESFTINSSSGVHSFSAQTITEACVQKDGMISLSNFSGGVGPYTCSIALPTFQNDSVFSGLSAGNYTVTVKDSNGCTADSVVKVGSVSGPVVAPGNTTKALCFGSTDGTASVNASGGSGGFLYTWDTPVVQFTVTASGLAAGNYKCVVEDSRHCKDSAVVSVGQPSKIILSLSSSPTDCTIDNGSATVVPAGGMGTYTCDWNTNPVQHGPTASGLGAGNWTLTVYDQNNCRADSSVIVQTKNGPQITFISEKPISCADSSNGEITTSVGGGTPLYTMSWDNDPTKIDSVLVGSGPGTHTLTVVDKAGCKAVFSRSLIAPDTIKAILTVIDDACHQSKGKIVSVASGGTGNLNYNWNTPSPQNTPTATMLDSGSYTLTVSDQNLCSKSFTSDVGNIPGPLISSISHGDVSCEGGNDGSAVVVANGPAPISYSWNTIPIQQMAAATGLKEGKYICSLLDTNGCTAADSVVILYKFPIPVFTLGPDTAFCSGDSVSVGSATLPADSYLWNNGSPGAMIYAKTPGQFRLTITRNGCSYQDTILVRMDSRPLLDLGKDSLFCGVVQLAKDISVSGTATYKWGDGSTNPLYTFSQAGTYHAQINRFTCVVYDTVNYRVQPKTSVSLPSDQLLCTGEIYTAMSTVINGLAPKYKWSSGQTSNFINITQSGNYILTVTDSSCIAADTINVIVNVQPRVDLGLDQRSCEEQVISLSAGPLNTGFEKLWSTNDTSNTVQFKNSGIYTLVVTNINCADSDTVQLTFYPLPVFSLGNDTSICPGTSIDIGSVLSNAEYLWSTGSTDAMINVDEPGLYKLTITQNNCSSSDDKRIFEYPRPPILLENEAICQYDTLIIDASCAGCSYLWENGDTVPVQQVTAPHEKELLITDQHTCVNSKVLHYSLDESPECQPDFYVPNTFSPNDDGYNEVFIPQFRDELLTEYHLNIYDRWGQLIFNSTDSKVGWNGLVLGNEAQVDIYNWVITYRLLKQGGVKMRNGKVNLIR